MEKNADVDSTGAKEVRRMWRNFCINILLNKNGKRGESGRVGERGNEQKWNEEELPTPYCLYCSISFQAFFR